MATLSIGKAWEDSVVFVKREGRLLFPVAFAFVALPFVIFMQCLPPEFSEMSTAQTGRPPAVTPGIMAGMLLVSLVALVGALAIYLLALRPGASVGEALQLSLRRLPVLIGALCVITAALVLAGMLVVLLASVFVGLLGQQAAVTLMAVVLALACAYLTARFLMLNVVVADSGLGVIASIRESWKMTSGNLWRLVAFVAVFFLLIVIVQSAAQAVFGVAGNLIGGAELGKLLGAIASAAAATVIQVYFLVMTTRIYVQLRPE